MTTPEALNLGPTYQGYNQYETHMEAHEGFQYQDLMEKQSPEVASSPVPEPDADSSTTTSVTKKVKTGKFSCYHCGYLTNRINNLKRHTTTMHEKCERVLECCGIRFTNKANIQAHTATCHRDGYDCSVCGRKFYRKALLRRHMAIHNGRKDFVCSECGYASSHKSNLDRHRKVHQKVERPPSATACSGLVLPLKKRPYLPSKTKSKNTGIQQLSRRAVCKKTSPMQKRLPEGDSEMVPCPSPVTVNTPLPVQQNWTALPFHPPESRLAYTSHADRPVGLSPQWLFPDKNGLYEPHYPNLWPSPQMPMSQLNPVRMDCCRSEGPYRDPRMSLPYCSLASLAGSGTSSDPITLSPVDTSSCSGLNSDPETMGDRDGSRLRLFASPYKCFSCNALFSTQMQLAGHAQCCHPHPDVVALSIVNVLRKMHLHQNDPYVLQTTQPPMIEKHDMQTFLINI